MTTNRLTEAQRFRAEKRYVQGETLTAIGRAFGVSRTTVRNVLKQRGVDIRPEGKLTPEQRNEVARQYEAGQSQQELAEEYGVTVPAIRSLITRRSVELRRPVRTLDESVFDELTEEACYWIGFLFADGSVNSKPGATLRVSVGLAIVDQAHLEMFRNFLGSSNAVYVNKDGQACQFAVTSNKLAGRLLSLGRYADDIDVELTSSRHFWRGVVDGDGSVGAYSFGPSGRLRPQFRVVGRLALLREFTAFLTRNRMQRLYVTPHKSIYVVGTTGATAAEITCLLYADAKVALERKAVAAAALISDHMVDAFRRRAARVAGETVAQLPLFELPDTNAA